MLYIFSRTQEEYYLKGKRLLRAIFITADAISSSSPLYLDTSELSSATDADGPSHGELNSESLSISISPTSINRSTYVIHGI